MTTVRIDSASATPHPVGPSQDRDRGWAIAVHLLALLLSPLVAILVNVIYGPRSEFVHQHARAAINFQLNLFAAFLVSGLATAVSQGFMLLWVPIGLAYVVMPIAAAVRASHGHWMPYPQLIPFLRALPEPE